MRTLRLCAECFGKIETVAAYSVDDWESLDRCESCGQVEPKTLDADDLINMACEAFEDGETGAAECVRKFCKERGLDEETGDEAYQEWFIEEAVRNGIPRPVAEGRTKLSDHFSAEYISSQAGQK